MPRFSIWTTGMADGPELTTKRRKWKSLNNHLLNAYWVSHFSRYWGCEDQYCPVPFCRSLITYWWCSGVDKHVKDNLSRWTELRAGCRWEPGRKTPASFKLLTRIKKETSLEKHRSFLFVCFLISILSNHWGGEEGRRSFGNASLEFREIV